MSVKIIRQTQLHIADINFEYTKLELSMNGGDTTTVNSVNGDAVVSMAPRSYTLKVSFIASKLNEAFRGTDFGNALRDPAVSGLRADVTLTPSGGFSTVFIQAPFSAIDITGFNTTDESTFEIGLHGGTAIEALMTME